MKITTRKERLEWIAKKQGIDFAMAMFTFTDRQVKQYFDDIYPVYKDRPDYKTVAGRPTCIKCNREAEIIWMCRCGENKAVFDED